MRLTIPGRPITKKNSMRLVQRGGRVIPVPSRQFAAYQERAGAYIPCGRTPVSGPVNLQCLYYMPTRARVDLVNLLEATCDILVHYGVLQDDDSRIVASHDGSRVLYDKEHPRVEISIQQTGGPGGLEKGDGK